MGEDICGMDQAGVVAMMRLGNIRQQGEGR